MHHGLYRPNDPPKSNQQAQIDMIDAVLAWAGVERVSKVCEGKHTGNEIKGWGGPHTNAHPKNTSRTRFSLLLFPIQMADIGCGIGGSSRHVARAFPGATAHGITLSPVQAARANALAADAGLAAVARFSVGDALRPCPPLEEGGYDLVWSLESGEHMPDKRAFVRALASLAAPGGKVVIATWVHRDLEGERRGEGGGKERTEGSKRGVQRKAQNALSFSLSLQPAKPPSPPPTPPCWPPSTPPTTCRPGAAGRTTWS